jgi:uncharacterized protein (TIGR02246 family)
MKKLLLILPLVFLLCFTFGCQKAEEVAEEPGVKPLSAEDVAAIKATTEAFNQAVNSKDWEALAALYSEDAVLMPPNQPLVRGRKAILTWNEEFPPMPEFNIIALEIDGGGNFAYVLGTYSMTIALEGLSEPIQDTGKYIEIHRKQEDGSWLIAVDMFNSDLPPPPPPEKE